MTTERPNFLFFITDQQRADHMSCAGNPVLKTPHMDALAAHGRRFEKFYVNSGVCQTNRATIMTGRYVIHTGIHTAFSDSVPNVLPIDEITVAQHLKAAGYSTHIVG